MRTARSKGGMAKLDRRHVYILPTRSGVLFALILLGMLLGAVNYSLSLGFVLTFWLGGLGVVAMLHTWRNLAHLTVTPGRIKPVHVGDAACFHFILHDHSHRLRYAVGARYGKLSPEFGNVPADGSTEITLTLPTTQRGWLMPGRITIFTQFPLGLFHAWGYVEPGIACLVYPRPAPPGTALPAASTMLKPQGRIMAAGDEDFSGLRSYRTGDPMNRLDWKASARSQGFYTKEFQGEGQQILWLDWETTYGPDVETRLSQLTRWVLDADANGLAYGLRLPEVQFPPASGENHRHDCLQALALFGIPDQGPLDE